MNNMDINKFETLIGNSFFAEEYRGDLDTAWDELTATLEHVDSIPADDVDQRMSLMFCAVVLAVLTGNLQDAYTVLDSIKAVLDKFPHWGLRYTAHKLLVDYTRRYPPCLRFHQETIMPLIISPLADIPTTTIITQELLQSTKLYIQYANNNTDLHTCLLFQCVMGFPQQLRFTTTTLHPLYPDLGQKKNMPPDGPEAVIAQNAPSLSSLKEGTITVNADAKLCYLTRLEVELHYAMGSSSSAKAALEELYAAYEEAGDQVGMANCKLMQGDALLSPPFSSPLSYNLIPFDSSSTEDNRLWDAVEAMITPLGESAAAAECYDNALELFREANAPRGQAAVLLRQGCWLLDRVRALSIERSSTTSVIDSWNEGIEEAERNFDEAERLFGVDQANVKIVQAHRVLLQITRGHPTAKVKECAVGLGRWGREAKNELVAHFITMLLMRFARQEWTRYARFDAAVFAYECAYGCAQEIGDIILAFQSLTARLSMHNDMFNMASAHILMKQCLEGLGSVMEYYESRIALCPDTDIGRVAKEDLLLRKFNLLWGFNSLILNTCSRSGELEDLIRWQENFSQYLEHDDSVQMMRTAMQTGHNSRGEPLQDVLSPRRDLKTFWNTALCESKIMDRCNRTDIMFDRALSDGDLDTGEDLFRQFIDEAPSYDAGLTGEMARIVACRRIGDVQKAREILDSMTDSFLFNDRLDDFAQGVGVDMFAPTLASNAISACIRAQDWKRGSRVLTLIQTFLPSFLDGYTASPSRDQVLNLGGASLIAFHNQWPELAFRRLLQARQLIELGRNQTANIDARIGRLSSSTTVEIYVTLAHICVHSADMGLPLAILAQYNHGHHTNATWEEHALLFFEEGRARAVLDSLEQAETFSESLYKQRVATHLRSLSRRNTREEEELLQLESEMESLQLLSDSERSNNNALIDALKARNNNPGILFGHLQEDAVVIEATFSSQGSIVFCVTNKGIECYHQSPVRDVDIRRPVMEIMQLLRSMTGQHDDSELQRKYRLDILSRQIADVLLTPFADIILRKKSIIFSVSQPLTAFPFSALIFNEQPLFMHAAVSQIPSLTILAHLAQDHHRHHQSGTPTVSVFTNHCKNAQEGDQTLPMAGIEALNIAHMFSTWPILASPVTRADFRAHLQDPSISILHIGTHGKLNPHNPLMSSISIGDDFRVLDMSQIQSKAQLFVFAACLTGLGKATLGSDVLGFSHLVLSSGCRAYMGALWAVSDFATMCLMILFYRQLRYEPNITVTEALRRAQIALFEMNPARVDKFLNDLIDTWDMIISDDNGHDPEEIVPEGKYLLTLWKRTVSELDWTSPFFWASFVIMGYGSFAI